MYSEGKRNNCKSRFSDNLCMQCLLQLIVLLLSFAVGWAQQLASKERRVKRGRQATLQWRNLAPPWSADRSVLLFMFVLFSKSHRIEALLMIFWEVIQVLNLKHIDNTHEQASKWSQKILSNVIKKKKRKYNVKIVDE